MTKIWTLLHMELYVDLLGKQQSMASTTVGDSWSLRKGTWLPFFFLFFGTYWLSFQWEKKPNFHKLVGVNPRLLYIGICIYGYIGSNCYNSNLAHSLHNFWIILEIPSISGYIVQTIQSCNIQNMQVARWSHSNLHVGQQGKPTLP